MATLIPPLDLSGPVLSIVVLLYGGGVSVEDRYEFLGYEQAECEDIARATDYRGPIGGHGYGPITVEIKAGCGKGIMVSKDGSGLGGETGLPFFESFPGFGIAGGAEFAVSSFSVGGGGSGGSFSFGGFPAGGGGGSGGGVGGSNGAAFAGLLSAVSGQPVVRDTPVPDAPPAPVPLPAAPFGPVLLLGWLWWKWARWRRQTV
jgi:hypothetical protein